MGVKIRILNSANRTMQRAGFLKLLCAQTARVETTNLQSLGKHFVGTLLKRVRLTPPYSEPLRDYVKVRLMDKTYHDLRKAVLNGDVGTAPVGLEIQDLYLSDRSLLSSTGKLVEMDWRRYPYLATDLDLVKAGTYSIMTRALVLLAVTPKEEIAAFEKFDPKHNPLLLSPEQTAVLLYCFIDNDAEIIYRLFQALVSLDAETFDERVAGDLLPQIIRDSCNSSATPHSLQRTGAPRCLKIAGNIAEWKGKPYTGSGSRKSSSASGLNHTATWLFQKPDRHRFINGYARPAELMTNWYGLKPPTTSETRFFNTIGAEQAPGARGNRRRSKEALLSAGLTLKSTLGYSPITDVGLSPGFDCCSSRSAFGVVRTRTLLRAWQKEARRWSAHRGSHGRTRL